MAYSTLYLWVCQHIRHQATPRASAGERPPALPQMQLAGCGNNDSTPSLLSSPRMLRRPHRPICQPNNRNGQSPLWGFWGASGLTWGTPRTRIGNIACRNHGSVALGRREIDTDFSPARSHQCTPLHAAVRMLDALAKISETGPSAACASHTKPWIHGDAPSRPKNACHRDMGGTPGLAGKACLAPSIWLSM